MNSETDFSAVIARHPRPWRVTEAYKRWAQASGHAENPPAIVDALYRDIEVPEDRRRQGFTHVSDEENDKHIIVTSSEWLHMSVDAAELMVAAVNNLAGYSGTTQAA